MPSGGESGGAARRAQSVKDSVHFVSPLQITMPRDVARVRTKTELPIERSPGTAMERYALRVPTNASIDVVGDALDDAPIKA